MATKRVGVALISSSRLKAVFRQPHTIYCLYSRYAQRAAGIDEVGIVDAIGPGDGPGAGPIPTGDAVQVVTVSYGMIGPAPSRPGVWPWRTWGGRNPQSPAGLDVVGIGQTVGSGDSPGIDPIPPPDGE